MFCRSARPERGDVDARVDDNYWFNPAAYTKPPTTRFGNGPRNNICNPGQYQWDIAFFKNVNLGGTKVTQFRAEVFNFPNHANWNGVETSPTSAAFGRITSKDNSRRDVQLSLRFLF